MPLPYPMPPVSPFDTITAQETNERIANIESLAAGTGLNTAAVTGSKIDFSTAGVKFFAASSLTITFVAPYNCIVEIEAIIQGTWAFGGGTSTLEVSTVPTGLTTIVTMPQTIEGGNTIPKPLGAKRVLSGLVAGTSYTFTAVQTNPGTPGTPRILAKCYPA